MTTQEETTSPSGFPLTGTYQTDPFGFPLHSSDEALYKKDMEIQNAINVNKDPEIHMEADQS